MANRKRFEKGRNKARRNQSKSFCHTCFSKFHEIKEQEKRVDRLQNQQDMKEKGLTAAGGLMKSVENLERWENRVKDLEAIKAWFKAKKIPLNQQFTMLPDGMEWYTSAKLKDAKETVLMLKSMKEKSEKASNEMSDLTKELIENGAVNQWAKKPIYYFVKGLRKVALVIDEGGNFKVSKKYPATSDKDQAYLEALGIKS